jgi:hypothetical protein
LSIKLDYGKGFKKWTRFSRTYILDDTSKIYHNLTLGFQYPFLSGKKKKILVAGCPGSRLKNELNSKNIYICAILPHGSLVSDSLYSIVTHW